MNVALRRARKDAKLTQEQLAAKSGVDQTSISRIEVTSSQPSEDTKKRLAEALGVDVSDIFPLPAIAPAQSLTSAVNP
jgi:transcriptional regulator with XRE-family HTH domain